MFEMIMDAVMPYIFQIVITVISLVVSYYVIPCIKADLIPFLKEKRLYNIVKSCVQAAEKMTETGIINKDDKKKYVINLLKSNGIVVNEMVDAFIESCVKELDLISSAIYDEIIVEEEIDKEIVIEESDEENVG